MPVPWSQKRLTLKERNDKINKLWKEGMTATILSERFGLSYRHVRNILKGVGLWRKSPG